MRGAPVLAVSALLGACVAAPRMVPAPPEPRDYICRASLDGDYGRITDNLWVSTESGRPYAHELHWRAPMRLSGVTLALFWRGEAPEGPWQDWEVEPLIEFRTVERPPRDVRLEIRDDDAATPLVADARYRERSTRAYLIYGRIRWSALRERMRGRSGLDIVLARPDGTVVARDRLDTAALDLPAQAIAALRPSLDAMASDFRTRCEVPPEIVIASRPVPTIWREG